jgi:hypothetical protein
MNNTDLEVIERSYLGTGHCKSEKAIEKLRFVDGWNDF